MLSRLLAVPVKWMTLLAMGRRPSPISLFHPTTLSIPSQQQPLDTMPMPIMDLHRQQHRISHSWWPRSLAIMGMTMSATTVAVSPRGGAILNQNAARACLTIIRRLTVLSIVPFTLSQANDIPTGSNVTHAIIAACPTQGQVSAIIVGGVWILGLQRLTWPPPPVLVVVVALWKPQVAFHK
jgi:hypothetical protein